MNWVGRYILEGGKMINEYLRPESVKEALELLTDTEQKRKPLGGGTRLSRQQTERFGVVDLQKTGLDEVVTTDSKILAGAMVILGTLAAHPDINPEIQRAIKIDASENIRNAATLGGWMITGSGRSIFSTVLLAMDAGLVWEPGDKQVQMGDWLPLRSPESPGVLITSVMWRKDLRVAFEYVARSPKDRPILVLAAAQWGSGRTRIALGGYGPSPIIALDGPDDSGVDVASRDAYYDADDQWATAEYRREVAPKMALRCLNRIDSLSEGEV
jgi:CO/xanthine dehydrogenase FAD-binding subunit